MGDTGEYCSWEIQGSTVHGRYRGVLFMGDTGEYSSWEIQGSTVHGRYRGVLFMGDTGEYCSWEIHGSTVHGRFRGIHFMEDTGVFRNHVRYRGIQETWEIQGDPGNRKRYGGFRYVTVRDTGIQETVGDTRGSRKP